jgi:hypothetical protein
MSRMKDLVTDVTFALVSYGQRQVKPGTHLRSAQYADCYEFLCAETGAALSFYCVGFPTLKCTVTAGNDAGRLCAPLVTKAFRKQFADGGALAVQSIQL